MGVGSGSEYKKHYLEICKISVICTGKFVN